MRLLNVGGGSKAIPLPARYEGWEHVLLDIAPGPDVDIVMDARDLHWDHKNRCYDAVYCAHNLEHYADHEVGQVLAGFWRVLKGGGHIHIVVPNIGQLICEMVEHHIDLEDVLYMTATGEITPLDVLYGYGPEVESGNPFYAHKTGFTARRLHRVLEEAGFKDVKVVANLATLELEGTGHV
jgi:SAM-dependent methyltransferase